MDLNIEGFHLGLNKYDNFRIIEGIKYKVYRSKCPCSCHSTGAIHIMACCNGGFIEHLEQVDDDEKQKD